jgi:GT2 family glycosyltransferase
MAPMNDTGCVASVLICTRNRSSLLEKTLRSVLRLECRHGDWEVVVVDNGSTDDTHEIACAVAEESGGRMRVVVDTRLGLSNARNFAANEAAAPLLLYLDDDAYPGEGWLNDLVAAFDDPQVMAAGGPVFPLLEGEVPDWFLGRFLPYISAWDPGDEPLDLRYNEYPRGANMAFRKSALDRWGGFPPFLGRKGSSLLSCEEVELCLRLERGGGRILYVPTASVEHLTPIGRMTPGWLVKRFGAQGASEAILNWRHGGLAGLRTGFRGSVNLWLTAREERVYSESVVERCYRATVLGYLRAMVTAPLRIPRYRPAEGDPVQSWVPFG